MRSAGGRPTRLTRLAGTALAIVAFLVLPGAAPYPAGLSASVRTLVDAPTQGGGSSGPDLLALILIVGAVVAVIAILAVGVVLLRTRGPKAVPPSEGWWTCPNCGAGNMDGAARCHACATWRTTTPRSTTSASP